MIVLKGGPARGLTFSPDGRLLLLDWGGWWELPAGVQLPDRPLITCPVFMDADRLVAVDRTQSVVQLDPSSGAVVRTAEHPWPVSRLGGLTATPDRTRLLAVNWHSGSLVWWSWPDLTVVEALPGVSLPAPAQILLTARGGLVILGREGGLTLIDAATGRHVWETPVRVDRWAAALAGSPDGRWLALASRARLRVYSAEDGQQVAELRQPARYFLDATFTPDGRFLATVSFERTVKFFDTSSWRLCHELAWQAGGLRALAFSPDGMLAAAGGWGKKVVVWDMDL